jgi:hypothetical protein
VTTGLKSDFRTRARYEAERYGADDWVFVRELLQNARDAGAGRVWFEVGSEGGLDRVACRDDGEGMTFTHARNYLFTLYASSKRGGPRNAGRFGIGFWSILRFSPSAMTVRSRPVGGTGWQVRLDGDLEVVRQEAVRMDPGTEVVIEREAAGGDIEGLLRTAVLRDAPFVTQRNQIDRPLEVRINGELVRADFNLPPPSMKFRRRGLRGVVGLGSQPKVEIFVHGLRVRDAASLDDLLLTGRRGRAGLPNVTEGLAPQAMIDSSALTVLLARGDAREDRPLRRLVDVGHRELRRLVRAELDRHVRPSTAAFLVERACEAWTTSRPLRAAIAVLLVAFGLAAGWRWIAGGAAGWRDTAEVAARETAPRSLPGESRPYADLGALYRGPDAGVAAGPSAAVALTYRPADERFFFAALVIVGIDPAGIPEYPLPEAALPTGTAPCGGGCLDVELEVAAGAGLLRLPVATGYVVDPNGVRLNGDVINLAGAVGGLPAVDLGGGGGGRLTYRSAAGPGVRPAVRGGWPPLPPELSGPRAEIASLPPDARAAAAAEYVRRRVVYDVSAATASRHLAEQRNGRDLFERSLIVGAGDCDVQNAMVAALLDAVGTPSRLAVGWVGEGGHTRPGLHAWVEYLASDGRWRVVDASAGSDLARVSGGAPIGAGAPGRAPNPVDGRVLLGVISALLIGLGLWFAGWRAHRSFNLGGREEFAGLVRAAAVHPEAFAGMHVLFARRVVPVLGGGSISMARARAAAGAGRLAVGGRNCDLAARAAVRGTVIDRDDPVGAVVADALGAADLDEWQEVLARSRTDPVATRVGEALRKAGAEWQLIVARDVGEEIAVFDGPRLGLPGGERWLVVDASGGIWHSANDLARRHPSAAVLLLADSVTDRLGLPPATRNTCLAGLARAALGERGGGGS